MRSTLQSTLSLAGMPGQYRPVSEGPGEPHVWRDDLAGRASASGAPDLRGARSLLSVAHLSDLHVMDASSPARAEHCQLLADDPRWHIMLPMHRPNELLVPHALAALAATISADPVGVVSGAPLDLTLVTGDCIDNAQLNELDAYLALLDGGTVDLPYDGVQSGWGGDGFWCPEASAEDRWKRDLGFPSFNGLLGQLQAPFTVAGLGLGWLAVVGNHDWLRQGTAITSAAMEAIAVGDRKATSMPPGFQPADVLRAYLDDPASYSVGAPTRAVRPDAGRRAVSKDEFISAHMTPAALIAGHGFSPSGAPSGDYVHDLERVRIIALDTNHPAGHYQGSVGQQQLDWLDARIRDAGDRWVVVTTHHGPESLTNDTPDPLSEESRLLAEPVVAVLHRHRNVVAWLCGHRHVHRITPRPAPGGQGGFWEIVTASVIDWPSQARVVELLELPHGALVIACTVVDHAGELNPGPDAIATLPGLAGMHREIGANFAASAGPARVAHLAGTPGDRNAILGVRQ